MAQVGSIGACFAVRVASLWRGVFDLSEEAETPARAMAAVQVGVVVGVISLVLVLVLSFRSNWQSSAALSLTSTPLIGFGLAAGSYVRLRRLRRERQARVEARRRRSRRQAE